MTAKVVVASSGNKMTKMKRQTAGTVFVRFSPPTLNRQTLETYFSEVGPVKKCSIIRSSDAEAKGFGFVKFTSQEDANEAARRFQRCKLDATDNDNGTTTTYSIQVELASEQKASSSGGSGGHYPNHNDNNTTHTEQTQEDATSTTMNEEEEEEKARQEQQQKEYKKLVKQKRTARVIIRNLSFYANERDVKKALESKNFGTIVDINIPTVPGTKSGNRGFGFVTFDNALSAQKAVSSGVNIIIKKRPVAIDFSISKNQHRQIKENQSITKEQQHDNDKTNHTEENDKQTEKSDNSDDDSSDDDDDSGDSDDESDSTSDDENKSDEDDDESMESDSDDDDDDASSNGSDDEDEPPQKIIRDTKYELFLRNIPFDATRHDLFELFRSFGRIKGIFMVKDRTTSIGKGTAFVQFENEGGCHRALEAANSSEDAAATPFVTSRNIMANNTTQPQSEGALYLNGRRILVDMAVDKGTAETLKVERGEDGKPLEKQTSGKDRRNLYLTTEGRVEGSSQNEKNEEDEEENPDPNAWENLPESDRLKRQRAFHDKSTKLRSPLFFINPFRLSVRNLAGHVDEAALKSLMVKGIVNGLKNNLVDRDDVIAHWKAAGDANSTTREIMKRIADIEAEAEASKNENNKKSDGDPVIPEFIESMGIKNYIPSVFIDRDFTSIGKKATIDSSIKNNNKTIAPSRGFGFVEFTHHVHALACLRELNNNPEYSAEYVSGGKKAIELKKRTIKSQLLGNNKKNKRKRNDPAMVDETFAGDDGRIRLPRLIVEFTVENKAKAKKQAERRSQQLANAEKQKLANMAKKKPKKEDGGTTSSKKKDKGRGARQRQKKRERQTNNNDTMEEMASNHKNNKKARKSKDNMTEKTTTMKQVKPPKKKKKVDSEDVAFENMVQSYKASFQGNLDKGLKNKKGETNTELITTNPRASVKKKRWFH